MFNQKKDGVQKAKKDSSASTQQHLRIAEFRQDTIVMKDGTIRAVLKTSSQNFSLKSEKEQDGTVFAYMSFLNSLEYPVQIVVRSRKLNLDTYLTDIATKAMRQQNTLLKKQMYDYIDYVAQLLERGDIMKKDFYVVVPYGAGMGTRKVGIFDRFSGIFGSSDSLSAMKKRTTRFIEDRKSLMIRVNQVKAGLEACALSIKQLSTSQLVELMYESYNPITSQQDRLTSLGDMDIFTPELEGESLERKPE